jgi:hypothetical protein
LKKFYFEQNKLTHTENGVNLTSFSKINVEPINEGFFTTIEKLLVESIQKITKDSDYLDKFIFVDDDRTIAYVDGGIHDGHYEALAIYNKAQDILSKYLEKVNESYFTNFTESNKSHHRKKWNGLV